MASTASSFVKSVNPSPWTAVISIHSLSFPTVITEVLSVNMGRSERSMWLTLNSGCSGLTRRRERYRVGGSKRYENERSTNDHSYVPNMSCSWNILCLRESDALWWTETVKRTNYPFELKWIFQSSAHIWNIAGGYFTNPNHPVSIFTLHEEIPMVDDCVFPISHNCLIFHNHSTFLFLPSFLYLLNSLDNQHDPKHDYL